MHQTSNYRPRSHVLTSFVWSHAFICWTKRGKHSHWSRILKAITRDEDRCLRQVLRRLVHIFFLSISMGRLKDVTMDIACTALFCVCRFLRDHPTCSFDINWIFVKICGDRIESGVVACFTTSFYPIYFPEYLVVEKIKHEENSVLKKLKEGKFCACVCFGVFCLFVCFVHVWNIICWFFFLLEIYIYTSIKRGDKLVFAK